MRRLLVLLLSLALSMPLGVVPATAADFQIINGSPADPGEYPAMAALVLADPEFQFCGGTLIHPSWVVTAAHCFSDGQGGSQLQPGEVQAIINTPNWTQGGERIVLDQIVLHPEYDDFASVNDIALLHLSSPAAAAPYALVPADGPDLYAAGRPATVIGYGTTTPDGREPSETLLEVDLPLVDDASCAQGYDNIVFDRHTCAGQPGPDESQPGPDTCQGDSGGPMFTDDGTGRSVLIGITSFGGLCGVQRPGVYTEVRTYLGWVDNVISGAVNPGNPVDPTVPDLPDDASVPPFRIVSSLSPSSQATLQAVEISHKIFSDGEASFGVVATALRYPDALGGSALAGGDAPLLFTGADGRLDDPTIGELRRAVRPGSTVYVLGGVAAVPPEVDEQIRALGMEPVRLAGGNREETAARVAGQVLAAGDAPQTGGTMVVATSGNWPDAVTVGQVAARWGTPVLLTPVDRLHPATADVLQARQPDTVLVIGGTAAISDQVVALIEQLTGAGTVTRLGGTSRFETAQAVADYNVDELFTGARPAFVVAVNLRREADAFAHVLAASMLSGRFGAVFAAMDGDDGSVAPPASLDAICGIDAPILIAGGVDLVADAAIPAVQQASGGAGCADVQVIDLGDLVESSITEALQTRVWGFAGVAGQVVRVRMDTSPESPDALDPLVSIEGPGGFVATDDDGGEGFNSLLEVTLPADGTYRVVAGSFEDTIGEFLLSLDPAPVFETEGVLEPGQAGLLPIPVTPGTRVVAEMRSPDGSGIDPVIEVYADDVLIAVDDDGGGFPHARVDFLVPAGTTEVDLLFTSFGQTSGPFTAAVFQP